MNCVKCNTAMTAIKDKPYRYTECGLDNVEIIGITVYRCESCEEEYVSIPKVKELHNVLGEMICMKDGRLLGKEVVFLRKEMRKNGREFALMLDITAEHLSRIEHDAKTVTNTLGKLIRALYMIYSHEGKVVSPAGTFEGIAKKHTEVADHFDMQLNTTDWLTRNSSPQARC